MALVAESMTTPVYILRRIPTTDETTGQVSDSYEHLARVLAAVEIQPLAEVDEAGQVRSGLVYRLTIWRDGLIGRLSVRDQVQIHLREGVRTAEIASIVPQGVTLVLEAREYDSG